MPTLRAFIIIILVASSVWAQPEALPGIIPEAEFAADLEEARGQARDARAAVAEMARLLGYSDADIERVLKPTMIRNGEFEVTLEDGTRVRFPWFRTGYAENSNANTERAIARDADGNPTRSETNKGGVRLHRGVFAEEVYALALKMDAKLAITGDAVAGESIRGAKGGIGAGVVVAVGSRYRAKVGDHVDPAADVFNRAELIRGFGRGYLESGARVGLGYDVHAGDVNTKAPEMKVLSDTYDPRAPSEGVSGKALIRLPDGSVDPRGGIEYRAISTGEGVWMSARHALNAEAVPLTKATVAGQGWGEVGRAFGLAALNDGARLVAIQELWNVNGELVPGVLNHPKGAAATNAESIAWVKAVEALRASGSDLRTFKGGELFRHFKANGDVSTLKVDAVGYNAMGNVLNETTVPALAESGTTNGKRKVIVEGANLAETAAGARALDALKAKLLTVPGDLANLGGVHVSNLEAIQNRYGQVVTNEQARVSLERAIASGWERATELAKEHKVSMRKAIELLSADELMKRSLQKPDATRTSLEKGIVSEEALARYAAQRGQGETPLKRVLERLAPFRRGDGTLKWGEVARKGALREGGSAVHFALALFLKEVAVVASTGDRARIDEFFEGLLTTDFYKHYGLFVVGARAGEIVYTKYLQRYVKPRFVSGLLKTNLVLAAGLALPLIVDGRFEGKAFAISLGSLGLSSAAVRAGVSGIKWVMDLRQAQTTGALGKVAAGAGRLARIGGWFYTAAELAVILYVAETIETRVNEYLDLAAAQDELADAGEALLSALAASSVDGDTARDATAAYRDAWTRYRNFLYRPLDEDEAILAERLAKLARKAKLTADERAAALSKIGKHPALKANIVRRHGSLEAYARAMRSEEDAETAAALATAMKSYDVSRNRHLDEVYHSNRREGGLLTDVDHLPWLLDGSASRAAADPWASRTGPYARWGRWRSRSALRNAFERASLNRLQTYADEAEVLAALAARLRARGHGDAADVLAAERQTALLLGEVDKRLIDGGGFVDVTSRGSISETLRRTAGE